MENIDIQCIFFPVHENAPQLEYAWFLIVLF